MNLQQLHFTAKDTKTYKTHLKILKPHQDSIKNRFGISVSYTEKRVGGNVYKKYYMIQSNDAFKIIKHLRVTLPKNYKVTSSKYRGSYSLMDIYKVKVMSFQRSNYKKKKYQQHTENGLTKGFVVQQIQKQTTEKVSSSRNKDYKRDKNWKKWI